MDGGQDSKIGSGPSVQVVAEELRGQQQQQIPSGVSPRDQLKYLAQLLNFEVEFSDFPKVGEIYCIFYLFNSEIYEQRPFVHIGIK